MKFYSGLLALAATAKLASAHTTVFAALINDADQGQGNNAGGYIRSPPNNNPLLDVTSSDMTCNVNGKNAVAKTLSVKAGDKFSFEWHHNSRDASDDIIDPSHKGPVMVYIAPTAAGTAGNGWVKIYEDGYDPSTKKWAIDKLIANKGIHSVTIPNVAAGEYLLRAELIALHEANRDKGAQFYMECVQVKITSNGDALPAGVSIPGAYSAADPGIKFDLYSGDIQTYPFPGPAVWSGAAAPSAGSSGNSSGNASTSTAQTPTTLVTSTMASGTAPSQGSSQGNQGGQGGQGGQAAEFQQCGGMKYSGPTQCADGLSCKVQNPYYSQCLKG